MGQVKACTDALIAAIRQSADYRRYEEAEKALEADPGLKQRIDEYRLRAFRLQESGENLLEQSDRLLEEFEALHRDPLAAGYLDAESSVCRLLQRVVRRISDEVAVELPRAEH